MLLPPDWSRTRVSTGRSRTTVLMSIGPEQGRGLVRQLKLRAHQHRIGKLGTLLTEGRGVAQRADDHIVQANLAAPAHRRTTHMDPAGDVLLKVAGPARERARDRCSGGRAARPRSPSRRRPAQSQAAAVAASDAGGERGGRHVGRSASQGPRLRRRATNATNRSREHLEHGHRPQTIPHAAHEQAVQGVGHNAGSRRKRTFRAPLSPGASAIG